MAKIRCSLSYKKLKVDSIPIFAGGVRDGIYTNILVFPAPSITQLAFQELINAYITTREIYVQGGKGQKGAYEAAKEALFEGLDDTATYVNSVADGDENIITLAGFEATKGSLSDAPKPVQVTGVKVKAGDTGVLHAECDKQDVALSYGCIMTAGQPLPANLHINGNGQMLVDTEDEEATPSVPSTTVAIMAAISTGGLIDFNMARKKTFTNLTRGVTYYFYFFAVNARGVGALSLPAQGWCV